MVTIAVRSDRRGQVGLPINSSVNNPPPKTGRACGEGYRNVSV
ncbi:hypothetical protein KSB_35910 [Ktedonobacter robiniae]|uniref:Uncharacterized protein n=1 Tax=Ktedonobacter robiniae TaxID=2778365 RepID=A0ABQ3UQP9_9CHLR|nr:hypothetical protein KSB_35910 [Ktedonobacter robiniae]